jgi:hypothetical protein
MAPEESNKIELLREKKEIGELARYLPVLKELELNF